jgi:hypothetical protein
VKIWLASAASSLTLTPRLVPDGLGSVTR